jgi:pyruvate dehydrogenase E2 component (dihydrolipoamide acetyltransferase)
MTTSYEAVVLAGGAAGGFLRFVADCVEDPAVLLAAV